MGRPLTFHRSSLRDSRKAPAFTAPAAAPATGGMRLSRTRGLAVEALESRLNLSTLMVAGQKMLLPDAGGAQVHEVAPAKRYRIDAWSDGGAGSTFGASWENTRFPDAQKFFDQFKARFTPYVAPDPGPIDNTPDPVPPVSPPPPPPPPSNLPPVTITQNSLGNLTRLTIIGTSGNDSIVVSQSGDTLTIIANGVTSTVSGNFGELAIYGGDGSDSITVQSSVDIRSLLYGGAGTNTLVAGGFAKSYIVTLGGGTDTVTGNGVDTSFWVDGSDTVHASAAERSGDVHRISSFYQPFSNNPSNADYISTALTGPNLRDPTDSGTTTRLTDSLWGAGPTMSDVNQGQVGDCYFLSSIQSMALKEPGKLQEMAVDLGDGTYAVEFQRNGTSSYVRVDADVPVANWGGVIYDRPLSGGAMWSSLMEKAYAFFRSGTNTYASLNWGWTGAAFSDLGIATSTFSTGGSAGTVFNTLTTGLANGNAEAAITNDSIVGGAPVIGSHAYTVVATSVESGIQYVTLRNPWGFDGAGNDSNTGDGLVKLTLSQFMENFSAGSIAV